MPGFPDFVAAVELTRQEPHAAGHADAVAHFFAALDSGDIHGLEALWPGNVVVYDPRAGEIRGHKRLRRFVRENKAWMTEHCASIETVASTSAGGRAVVELLPHVDRDGQKVPWPLAVVAESPDEWSVVLRTYCSQWPVTGQRPVRAPILEPGDALLVT